jgi:hypothetical protein
VHDEIASVLAIVCVLWLLHRMDKVLGEGNFVRKRNNCIHITSLIVFDKA